MRFEEYIDAHYPDERMQRIFANAEFTEDREERMQEEADSQNNFRRLEELSHEMGKRPLKPSRTRLTPCWMKPNKRR